MTLKDIKVCHTNFGVFLGKPLKNGKVSKENKELTKEEIEDIIAWYGRQYVNVGEAKSFELNDGSKIVISHTL